MSIRRLEVRDIDCAGQIARLRDRHSGTAPIEDAVLRTLLDTVQHALASTQLYGYFDEDGVLISWAALRFGELHGVKTWAISNLFTSQFGTYFSWNRPELGSLIATGFGLAEARGYYDYVYAVSKRIERVYDAQWSKNKYLPPTGRYTRELLIEVPANELAPQAWMNRLAGLPKPDPMIIYKRSLKPEHRRDSNQNL